MDVLARLCIRHLFTEEEVSSPNEGLFFRFEFVEDQYAPLWGVENQAKFQLHVQESNWQKQYSIFDFNDENKVELCQAYSLFKEIQSFHLKLVQGKKQLEKIKQDNLQKDLRRIDREQVIGQQHKYAKPKKTAKKSYKEKE